jgi:hypothetical protein
MKTILCELALTLALVSRAAAQGAEPPPMPTWQEEITKGFVPYHQLTVEDFKIDDQAHPEGNYWIQPFMHPRWQYLTKRNGDWFYAYVIQWIVFSGFDKNDSSRKSKFREMKRSLPFAQAYLDICEIHARQLATLKPGELPSARGATPQEARTTLQQNVDAFLKEKSTTMFSEAEEFAKATDHGRNEKKVRELAKAIRKRLDATPAPTGPPYDLSAATTRSSPAPEPGR